MGAYLLQGLILGASAAATPGPFQAYLLSQSLKIGWKKTLPASLAPLFSDGPILALLLLILSQLPRNFLRVIQICGGIFLLYLAWEAYQAYRLFFEKNQPSPDPNIGQQSFAKATLVNALSPGPYLFWSLVGVPLLLDSWRQMPALGLSFLAGFYSAIVGTNAVLVILFGTARNLGPRLNRILLGFSALALFGLGLYQTVRGLFFYHL